MTWYYAHSMLIYNTRQELSEIASLKMLVGQILNPNGDIPPSKDMRPYLDAVRSSNGLVCSEVNGHIGKGVFSEVAIALGEGKNVFVLRNSRLTPVLGVEIVNPDDWKYSYGRVVAT